MTAEENKTAPKVGYDFFVSLVLKRNNLAIQEILLNDKFDINKEDFRGATALHYVAELDDVELLKILIKQPNIKINAKTLELMSTPLMIASGHGSKNCLKYLLENGADSSLQNATGYTALMIATESNSLECVEILLSHGAGNLNIKAQNQNGLNALMFAISNLEIMKRLLNLSDLNQTDISGYSVLHLACLKENGSLEVVKMLLEADIFIDSRSINNETPLHCAFIGGNKQIVNFLVEKGASLIARDSRGFSAFAFAVIYYEYDEFFLINHKVPESELRITFKVAARKGHLNILKLLLEEFKIKEQDLLSCYEDGILESAKHGHLKCVKLLSTEFNFNDRIILFEAVMLALQSNNFLCFEYLYRCYLDKKSEEKQNLDSLKKSIYFEDIIIKEAFSSGCTEACKLFLDQGIDSNGNDPETYIMAASGNGFIEIVKMLISHGANINYVHKRIGSALLLATTNGHFEIVQILLENGADPSISDIDGYTPLISAAFYGHEQIFECLIRTEDLSERKSNDGMTPFLAAALSGSGKILEILVDDYDVNINELDNIGNNCFHLAAEKSINLKALIYLLSLYPDNNVKMFVEAKNKLNETALEIVLAQQNHLSLFSLIAAQPMIKAFLISPLKQELRSFDYANHEMCLICRDEYLIDDIGAKLPCGHIFHENCYEEWAICKSNCPYCKSFPFKIKK